MFLFVVGILHFDSWPSPQWEISLNKTHLCKWVEAVTWLIGSRGRYEMIYADASWSQCESDPACIHWEHPLQRWRTAASGWLNRPRIRISGLKDKTTWYSQKKLWVNIAVWLCLPLSVDLSHTTEALTPRRISK